MANWYAGAVIYRSNAGRLEFLVIDTRSVDPKYKGKPLQTKFVGGTEEGHFIADGTPIGTLHRELTEETDMSLPSGYAPMFIHGETSKDHQKNFYLIPFAHLSGVLRTEEKTVDGDWMSPPYWISFEEACRVLFRTHQPALLKAKERLQAKVA